MPDSFIFQQDGAPAHLACNARLVTSHCNWLLPSIPNSPDFNLLDYHVWGAMLKAYHKLDITSLTGKPPTTEKLQTRLEMIWNDFPHKPVVRAVQNFRKLLQACMDKACGHLKIWCDRLYVNAHYTSVLCLCLRTRFPSSFLENFTWYALGWKFLLQNLRL